ncbi:hypothetical protein B0F90DRAFT_1745434 [Multifurca ochricompacta]|uniref:RanBD1 domain-containing protein n=1 Tax=Multifurca ochricompacta TaxID=376703 RepID=A0AAD4QLJ1_9AGAM|nr:hypothetical protein B0F90DRAFT_1745434 [Multifurca ochricompacta]
MSQSSSSHIDTEAQRSSEIPLSKEDLSAGGTTPVDNICPNLDNEVSAPRGVDLAIPQKREREVSLEPPTPHPDDTEQDHTSHEHRSRSPVKKSRALSTPAEVDEVDNEEQEEDALEHDVPTPSPHPSPPHETKVRQISQGVEDINWRNGQKSQNEIGDVKVPSAGDDDAASLKAEATVTPSKEPHSAPPPVADSSAVRQMPAPATASTESIPQPVDVLTHDPDNLNKRPSPVDATADSDPRETKRPTPPLSEIDGAIKRPREDEDGNVDPNPRETKQKKERPGRKKSGSDAHPPNTPASPRSKSASSFGGSGFLAYASVASPFGSVKGPTLFGPSPTPTKTAITTTAPSTTMTTTATATSIATPNAVATLNIAPSVPSSPPKTVPGSPVQRAASPTPAKRTGFEAFAAAASPFASVAARARSPVRRSGSPGPGTGARSNPFASYATGGAQGLFGASAGPAAKRARGDSDSVPPGESGGESTSWREGSAGAEKTFVERLRAGSGSGGDDDDEIDGGSAVWGEHTTGGKWAEQEVLTGEEEDETVHSVRGKLFMLSEQNQWKERGSGLLRLNRRRLDHSGARLVMRKDAVYAVLLNVTLFRGMGCAIAQDPRYLRFSVLTPSGTTHYNLRVRLFLSTPNLPFLKKILEMNSRKSHITVYDPI